MKYLITIILVYICLDSFCQQREIIQCPESALEDTSQITQYFLWQLENEFEGVVTVDGVTAKIYNPPVPVQFRLNNDYLLYAHSLGCITQGVKYYIWMGSENLNNYIPDGVTDGNPQFKDWLVNVRYSKDKTEILANIPYNGSFLTHEQAVILAYYFEITGNGRLINRKEWDQIYEQKFEDDNNL